MESMTGAAAAGSLSAEYKWRARGRAAPTCHYGTSSSSTATSQHDDRHSSGTRPTTADGGRRHGRAGERRRAAGAAPASTPGAVSSSPASEVVEDKSHFEQTSSIASSRLAARVINGDEVEPSKWRLLVFLKAILENERGRPSADDARRPARAVRRYIVEVSRFVAAAACEQPPTA